MTSNGAPEQNTKFYETPNHPFQGERIAEERDLVGRYGLKNKEELWRAQSELRSLPPRGPAAARPDREDGESGDGVPRPPPARSASSTSSDGLDDVLSLDVTDVLERRLQTVVYRKGLANTVDQARQFVTHGHVIVDGQPRHASRRTRSTSTRRTRIDFDETQPARGRTPPRTGGGTDDMSGRRRPAGASPTSTRRSTTRS
ncbi:MAG: 30S ribosomal protein S4 [Halodesulfurarchaeum sp.]|nr:30S ribosomal protein S4 [Halodesulfurarchaeum sp.]